jgi:hypothetical protein
LIKDSVYSSVSSKKSTAIADFDFAGKGWVFEFIAGWVRLLGNELTLAGLYIMSIGFAKVGNPREESFDLSKRASNVAIIGIPDMKHGAEFSL